MEERTEIDVLEDILTTVNQINTRVQNLETYTDGIESYLNSIGASLNVTNGHLNTIKTVEGEIRGAVPDIKNAVTDECIIRVYVGDVTEKREKASAQIAKLINQGYRPYMTFGISEDLARVLFVKYVTPNNPVV